MKSDGKIKFAWVVLCLLTAVVRLIFCRIRYGKTAAEDRAELTDRILLCLGLFMTVAADYCMVIRNENVRGLYCFLAVQLLCFLRLGRGGRELAIQSAMALAVLLCCAAAGISLGEEGGLGIIYITLFAGNLLFAGRQYRIRKNPCLFWGLLLFFLCDLHVGIMNLGDYVKLPAFYDQWVRPYSQKALWLFYLPSQLLISFSSCNRMIDKKGNG